MAHAYQFIKTLASGILSMDRKNCAVKPFEAGVSNSGAECKWFSSGSTILLKSRGQGAQLRFLKFALVFLLSTPIYAAPDLCPELMPKRNLDQKLDALFSEAFGDSLVTELRPQVEEIYARDHAMGAESLQEIFNLYIAKRLETLPAETRSRVWSVIENDLVVKSFSPRAGRQQFNGSSSLFGIAVAVPSQIYQTALDYVIRVHELEHIIQYHVYGVWPYHRLNPKQMLNRFLIERGAMRSEAAFLLLFDPVYLEGLLNDSYKSAEPQAYAYFKSALELSQGAGGVGAYVERMWEAGRYSPAQFRWAHRVYVFNYTLTGVFLAAPAWVPWFMHH